ncbi:metal-sulfur cluster biosynthetic protein [Bifidobacterium myosotis]|uniref:Metal-sulfur cluster biosynthetic protein n=1 Tax=Bifidobacterium myosotis TaxID=1630166 RepID=A0A261FDE9_9BIFI|nr:metal-sulfur cluster assembly factor [Bifidobacterium myosotis]OZG57190.1 metal-sulfur cluster biosynthetic protein [Bifidobacterium myosotis]
MTDNNLVPEPKSSIFDAVNDVLQDEEAARRVMMNPALAKGFPNGHPVGPSGDAAQGAHGGDACGCGNHQGACGCHDDSGTGDDQIPLKAVDDIGRATAEDVREALHQVIDPELGIDVIDLGLVYGIEIDELGRAIITMTLTTPACPLTDLIEDECASTLAGLVEEFRIDWTWNPRWTMDRITPEGRDQLAALGFNFDNFPTY